MKLLITGGAGFIGANYIYYLHKTYGNTIEIINVDALTYAGNLGTLKSLENQSNIQFIKARIEDKIAMRSIFESEKIDKIIHFAAESHVDRSIQDATPFVLTNVLGTQILLDCAIKYNVKRFVHISTDEVYGTLGKTGIFTEKNPLAPNSPYAASKAASDLLVRGYVETHGLDAVITRCSNNYGPYQFPEKLIPLMITNALENKSLPIYGNGLNIRDWIYVEDHCRGIDKVTNHGKTGEIYNLGGESEQKNIDIVKKILNQLGKSKSLITYVTDRPGHDFRYAMGIEKVKTELDWTPTVSFEEGLNKTIEWYLNNQSWWQNIKSKNYLIYDNKHNRKSEVK